MWFGKLAGEDDEAPDDPQEASPGRAASEKSRSSGVMEGGQLGTKGLRSMQLGHERWLCQLVIKTLDACLQPLPTAAAARR